VKRPHPWSDGNIVAVGWQLVFVYRWSWDRLRKVDPGLTVDEIERLLDDVGTAGNPVGPETPPHLPNGDVVHAQVTRLYELIVRAREAVAEAFTGPGALADQIFATCRFPRQYLSLPSPELASPDEVELVHLGDLPPRTPDWQHRSRLIDYPALRVLTLFNMRLGQHGFGIELGRLGQLESLDLRENGLDAIPEEVLACRSVRELDLAHNPLTDLPDLQALPNLSFLRLSGTRVPAEAVSRLRRQRPSLIIETSD
jgi:Leucine rich repeat